MSATDQGYMVQAMTNEGFDPSLFDIVFLSVIASKQPIHCHVQIIAFYPRKNMLSDAPVSLF